MPVCGDAGEVLQGEGKVEASDLVVQLLYEEEERVGITPTAKQSTAILKILRELVYVDLPPICQFLCYFPGSKIKGRNKANQICFLQG